jgi:putative spermidine/putrescine transport system permease protein
MKRTSLRRGRVVPNLTLIVAAVFFSFPLVSLARFALQNVPTFLLGWSTLLEKWSLSGMTRAFHSPAFWPALRLSGALAGWTVAGTLALLIPTAVWVHIRLPRLRPMIEFLTVLPYMIPPIALVAGIVIVKPHARWFLNSNYSLVPFYIVLALPFTYRSIDAGLRSIDLRTLVDASRSLGAGWVTTLRRVLVPNLRSAIVSASFLTAAVVMGEYTIANTLLKPTLPPFQRTYLGTDPRGGYGLNLLALLITVALFGLLGVLTRPKSARRATRRTNTIGVSE